MNGPKHGDLCQKCGNGHLQQKLSHKGGAPRDRRKIQIGRLYKTWWVIGRLECGFCNATFAAPNMGKRVEQDLIEPQIAGFTNPSEEPTICSHCGGDNLFHGVKENPAISERFLAGPNIIDMPGDVPYRYCADCFMLAWVFPTVLEHSEEEND